VDSLRAAGFRNTDISVLFPENVGSKDFRPPQGHQGPGRRHHWRRHGSFDRRRAGLAGGIGALAIPGLGPFIAAGPIMAALAGAGVGGAVGGITGALIGHGNP